MGITAKKFTLLRFFWSTNYFHALFLVVAIGVVTGTTLVELDVPQELGATKPQQVENVLLSLPQVPTDNEDVEDGQLRPFPLYSRVMNLNEDVVAENHILSRRRRRVQRIGNIRTRRQVQNSYERFYLCMFTLYTNPNCRDQQDSSSRHNYGQSQSQGGQGGTFGQGSDDTGYVSAFVPTSPPNNQHGFGLFGTGFGGNGLFGGRFGLHPSHQSFTNNYTPFFGQQQYYPQQNSNPNYYPPPQMPNIHQTPYPEQQVHRRPGPPPTFIPTISSTTTRKIVPVTSTTTRTNPTTTTTTRTNPTTTTTTTPTPRPTHTTTTTSTTRRTTTTPKPTSTFPTTRYTPHQINVESVLSTTFPVDTELDKSLDCDNDTASASSTQKIATTTTTTTSTTPTPPPPRQSYPDFSSAIKVLAKENSILKSDLVTIRSELSSYQVQNKYLQDALSTLQSDNSKLKSRVGQLERTNDHLQQQNGQLQHSTGDMRTQVNEMKGKVKYAEEKLVRLSRQGIDDQKQVTRLQNRVRELNTENNECKAQLYQLQLRHTQRIVHETATSVEMEIQGSSTNDGIKRYPQQIYRDDILSTSTEQGGTPPTIVEFDDNEEQVEGRTTMGNLVEDVVEVTTNAPEDIRTEVTLLEVNEPVTTNAPVNVSTSTLATPSTPTLLAENVTQILTSTATETTPEQDSSPEVYFPSITHDFVQHPGIIFDDDQFMPSIVGAGDDEDSNEVSILLGHPQEYPDRSIGFENKGQSYSPANFDAFSSFTHNQRPTNSNPEFNNPFNNYWPYQQYSSGLVGHNSHSTSQSQDENGYGLN